MLMMRSLLLLFVADVLYSQVEYILSNGGVYVMIILNSSIISIGTLTVCRSFYSHGHNIKSPHSISQGYKFDT